jgi:hypothetical protein
MFSLRLETISRFIGGSLLISMGIMVSLFVVSNSGGAVPSSSYALNPNFMNGSPSTLVSLSMDSILQSPITLVFDPSPAPHQTPVLHTTAWHTAPFKVWSLITATGVVFIGILYLLLKRFHFGMSEEIFP